MVSSRITSLSVGAKDSRVANAYTNAIAIPFFKLVDLVAKSIKYLSKPTTKNKNVSFKTQTTRRKETNLSLFFRVISFKSIPSAHPPQL